MALKRRGRVIALVGGVADPVSHHIELEAEDELRLYASTKEGGVGVQRRILESIKRGALDEVWILTCWIGHSQCKAIVSACHKAGVRVRLFGGLGQARREA